MRNKGQEEIMGFVLIVAIILIIGVVFLGISLRKGPVEQPLSMEIDSFLSSINYYTTDCEISGRYLSVESLVTKCYEQKSCLDGRTTCEVLAETLEKLVESAYFVAEGGVNQYYKLEVYYNKENPVQIIEEISDFSELDGVCKGIKIYNEKLLNTLDGDKLFMKFEVCKRKSNSDDDVN
ncbi:MAG: hypothetical protein U9Q06_01620 [Nanoarchaeota archaeon]|nr:hypothetical protein [Nanoarchaeota archaeon]